MLTSSDMTTRPTLPYLDTSPVIEVRNLVKEYRLGALEGIRAISRRMLGRSVEKRQLFRALDDVSFTIQRGEVVGLIGHNGAGKSTLLKHLCNVTRPTSGTVTVRGSVAPLLEVGAGLIGDMTGRENIFLNGTILGMTEQDIFTALPQIIEFSELDEFIDTPIKRYSSGMLSRLGFAIATATQADILLVDEVLSVGDLRFQKKCFSRMEHLIRRENRTVLIVSHNLRQIERFCSRAIFLDKGRIVADGPASDICELALAPPSTTSNHTPVTYRQRVDSSGEITLTSIRVFSDRAHASISTGDPLSIQVTFHSTTELPNCSIVIGTHTPDFIYLTAAYSGTLPDRHTVLRGENIVTYRLSNFPLTNGTYMVRFSVYDQNHRPVFIGENLKDFSVVSSEKEINKAGMRLLELEGQWL